ncbi:Suppression of tumorigenicity 5 protein [Araneus ventricosus]|uniref:Suppression of tumorigenicity 5 protein n=1 Tax=Araneus ventricosus TaxID=182803 RepID=A0A4Y2B6M0_ARAVE|nr:Suppression of tumorigenicity 5 protein [Araneus ventricosus]
MNNKPLSVIRENKFREADESPVVGKANVNIKEIRKRFEKLSGEISNESNRVPIAPLRKNKTVLDSSIKKLEKTHVSEPILKPNIRPSQSSNVTTSKKCISVKERTKLFEGNSEIKCDSTNSAPTNVSVNNITSQPSDTFKTKLSNSSSKNEFVTPPAKPPRTFASTDKLILQKSTNGAMAKSEVYRKYSASDVENSRRKQGGEFSTEIKPRPSSSFSFESNSSKEVMNSPRLMSAPEIATRVGNGDLTPKTSIQSSKSHGLRSYFKNLSNTATTIREKVKQSKMFVDLTPTTVSPPKHYGTLKRSRSEEHIYAEPYTEPKENGKTVEETKKTDELHYMCTPLIKPKVPERKMEKSTFNRQCVRDMIYGSFAPLRTVPKENQDLKAGDTAESDVSMKAIQDRIIYVKSVRQVSRSSICIAPKLYEALYIINISGSQPEVAHSFPLKVPEEYKFSLLPHICFPDTDFKVASSYQSATFHFTLFDKGEKIFGYCLRIVGWPKNKLGEYPLCVKLPVAICILSQFNAPLFYNKLLSELEKHLTLPRAKCFKYIRSLQKLGVPNAGASISIPDYSESSEEDRVVIPRPLDSHSVGCEFTRALQLLDVEILVKAVASLLLERRVLLFSSTASNLYECCKAISSLLYPFEWPHTYIPVLPSCLTVQCCLETPYILGLSNNNYNSVLELLAEHEVLIINIDKGMIVKSYGDEDTILPKKIQKAVITALHLAKNMTDPTEMLRDVMISEAFVHMFVEMVGHYENHLVQQIDTLAFQKEAFLKNAFFYSVQFFLQWFSETQLFDTFINECIWRANYRSICQSNQRTFFEKRVDEYKWELSHDDEKFSRRIEKTVRNLGEMIIHKLKM